MKARIQKLIEKLKSLKGLSRLKLDLGALKGLTKNFKGLKSFGGSIVGVDPGSYSVKLVRPKTVVPPFEIESCVLKIRNQDNDEQALREEIGKRGMNGQKAAFALADEKVESHEFHLPSLPKKELDTAIEWEIKKAVASPEYVYHDVLTFESEKGIDVQCIVAAKDIVKSRFEEGKGLGVEPEFLETESSALLACVTAMRPSQKVDRVVLLDLGYSTFRLIFIHRGRVTFTRSLYFGLATLCHQVASQIGAQPHEVQNVLGDLKADQTADPSNALLSALERNFQEILYTLCEEFRRSEFFIRDQKSLEDVEEVLLCGGGACLPFVGDYLKKHLNEKRIEVLNPFVGAKGLPQGITEASGPLWACALGLALREAT